MQNLSQKIKKITNRKRLAVVTFFTVIVLAGFGFAGQASAAYEASGNWTSTNLLLGETVTSVDSFVYNLSAKPANTDATIQFSQDNTNWYNSAGVLNASSTLTTGLNNTINLSGLGWTDANFYYKTTFTSSDGVGTPVLDDISITFTGDITAPTVSTLSPADDATAVAVDSNLVITFSEAVDAETGNINLYKTTGDVLVQAFNVTTDITGSGTNTITANPTSDLDGETDYYVKIDATAFDDAAGNSYAGIADATTWNFTSVDITDPTVSTLSPADDATGVATSSNLVITFSEVVDVETGNLIIKKTSDNSTIETIDVTGGLVTGTGTNTITINPTADLDDSTEYYVLIDATVFDDASSNSYAGIATPTTWNFTTVDETPPVSSGGGFVYLSRVVRAPVTSEPDETVEEPLIVEEPIEEEVVEEEPEIVPAPKLQIALEKEKLVEATKTTTVIVTKVVTDKRRVNPELVFASIDNPRISGGGILVKKRILLSDVTEEQKEVANLFTGKKLEDSAIKELEKVAETLITSGLEKSFENVAEMEIFNGGRKKLINKDTEIIFTADQRKVVDIQKDSDEDVIVVGPSTMGPGKVSLLLASIYDGDFADTQASKKVYFNGLRALADKDVPEPPLIPKVTNMHGNQVGTNALFWVAGQPQQKVYLYAVKKSLMDMPETWKTVDLGNYLIDENGQAIIEMDFEKYFKEVVEGLEIIVQTEQGEGSKIVVDYDPLMDFDLEYVSLSDGKIVAKPSNENEKDWKLHTSVLSASSAMISKSLKGEEEGISDPKFLTGYSKPGTVIFLTWKSLTYNSVVVADASQGYFEVRIPEELEQGTHEVIAYSVNFDTSQSSNFTKLFFSKLL